jgi:anti-anti-sigma factor
MGTGGIEFTVGVRREPERVVIAPTGELDIGSVPRLAAAFRSADGAPAVVLDLRELLFLDTSGLRAVIDEDRRAVADGGAWVERRLRAVARPRGRRPLGRPRRPRQLRVVRDGRHRRGVDAGCA